MNFSLAMMFLVFQPGPSQSINQVLDQFHEAAARADGETYFNCLSNQAVFIGTAAEETWTKSEFEAFCKPYFDKGRGWTYRPYNRKVDLAEDGNTAWFVEQLKSESYGHCRGTGVLLLENGEWKIAQYHLTIPIPNPLAGKVVDLIKTFEEEAKSP